jgi:hypothetical protein
MQFESQHKSEKCLLQQFLTLIDTVICDFGTLLTRLYLESESPLPYHTCLKDLNAFSKCCHRGVVLEADSTLDINIHGVFNSCLRSTLIFYLEKTGASLNFKTDL